MIKMNYGDEEHIKFLKDEYVKIFPNTMDNDWKRLRRKLIAMDRETFKNVFPTTINKVFIADFPQLVEFYLKYAIVAETKKEDPAFEKLHEDLKGLFKYSHGYQYKIADFFMNEKYGFDLHTCYYCDSAYINVYKIDSTMKKQFDLDHVLDKGKCPIVGLSLFNFVPSCPVCNERIKRTKVLGDGNEADMLKLSPTNTEYTFDEDVHIELKNIKGNFKTNNFLTKPEDYEIMFNTSENPVYDKEVSMFKLIERYNYHKVFALRLWDLKEKYTEDKMKEIARLFNVSPSVIKEDIFEETYMKDFHRAFGKMHKDIMNQKVKNQYD